MTDSPARALVRIGDTGQTVADPAADVRGRKVRDREGNDIGTVDDLLIDATAGKVRCLRVEHGGVLGIGATPSFIPVDAVTSVHTDTVYVDLARQQIAEAPRYDPELADQHQFYGELYGHYGYLPFWAPGSVYPGYPYLPG